MRWPVAYWLAVAWCVGSLGGCVKVTAIAHNQDQAAIAAIEFATVLLGQRDVARAYALWSDDARAQIPFDAFSSMIAGMHPSGMPGRVDAIEFEPVPGQEAMQIFLRGEAGGEMFYYRFAMQGTVEKGYQVAGVFRGSGPYPPSTLRQPLPVTRSAEFVAAGASG